MWGGGWKLQEEGGRVRPVSLPITGRWGCVCEICGAVEEGRKVESVWGALQTFPRWVLEAAMLVGPDDLCIPPAILESDS